MYPDTPFQNFLASIDACHAARAWVGEKTIDEAWAECQRGDWMRWLLIHADPKVRAAYDAYDAIDAAADAAAAAYVAAYAAAAYAVDADYADADYADAYRLVYPTFPHPTI